MESFRLTQNKTDEKLHYTTPHYTTSQYSTLHYTTLLCTTPHHTAQHYTVTLFYLAPPESFSPITGAPTRIAISITYSANNCEEITKMENDGNI